MIELERQGDVFVLTMVDAVAAGFVEAADRYASGPYPHSTSVNAWASAA